MADLIWRGDIAEQIARKAALNALHTGAEAILTEAIDETPILSGTLRMSGTVTDAATEGAVYISFNTPYAVKQHEDLQLSHPSGGKAKYLEDPFNQNKQKVLKLTEAEVKRALQEQR